MTSRSRARSLAPLLAAGLVIAASSTGSPARAAPGDSLAVRGATVHTAAGPPIEDGVVVVLDGKIHAVGPASEVEIPEGIKTVSAAVVTPGLIDAHTVVGLTGHLNQDHDQDQLERSAPIQPELRAIDAYDARERLVRWVRGFGVTTVHTGHAPGLLVSGQTLIAKTRGDTVDDAVIVPRAMLAVTLGEGALSRDEDDGPPGTRSKAVAMLRSELIRARDYRDRSDERGEPRDRDLRLEVLAAALDGEIPLMVTVHRHNDILAALRIRDEFGVRMVLDGASEAYLVTGEISRSGVPVIVHPTMKRAVGEAENLSMETAARLADAGVPLALSSGYESYVPKTRVLLFEAAIAAAYGLGAERALGAATVDAARLLGIDDRVGTLEVGKDGDLALFDGDPFEYTSHCVGTIIEGQQVSRGER
ncbi:MAG: amidohydrolase family protein [Acidobacteriota bacterium]|nr:amidohydrolase family protein [Acidobacteriota bacterium]